MTSELHYKLSRRCCLMPDINNGHVEKGMNKRVCFSTKRAIISVWLEKSE